MADKFLGSPYPITKDGGGLLHTQGGVDQIKSDLLSLLLTNPGERTMLPLYGTDLRQLIFEPNDAILQQQARDIIAESIRQFEPRVVIEQITVSSTATSIDLDPQDNLTANEHILLIKIRFFDPENIQSVEELKLEVPLTGT